MPLSAFDPGIDRHASAGYGLLWHLPNLPVLRKTLICNKTKNYLAILVSLALVFGGQAYLWAAEEASSIMCDNGVVDIGDLDVDVQDKCGEPNSQNMNEVLYNFGPSQPVYTVIFNEGKVVRILQDESGN